MLNKDNVCCGLHVTTGKQGQIHTVVAWDAWPVATWGRLEIRARDLESGYSKFSKGEIFFGSIKYTYISHN